MGKSGKRWRAHMKHLIPIEIKNLPPTTNNGGFLY